MYNKRTCTICNIQINQNFCQQCGQKLSTESTTVKSIITDFFNNLFSLDKSVFAAILTLLFNPQKIILNYWMGYRRYYASPGKMVVYALTIAALHLNYVNRELLGLSFDLEGIRAQFLFWLFFLPILFLVSFLSFFRMKHNFAKHIISITYLSTCFFIVLTLLGDMLEFTGIRVQHWLAFIFIFCINLWNSKVFNQGTFFRVAGGALVQLVILVLIMIGLSGMIYLLFPESIRW